MAPCIYGENIILQPLRGKSENDKCVKTKMTSRKSIKNVTIRSHYIYIIITKMDPRFHTTMILYSPVERTQISSWILRTTRPQMINYSQRTSRKLWECNVTRIFRSWDNKYVYFSHIVLKMSMSVGKRKYFSFIKS